MGYVKTPEEVEEILERFRVPTFVSDQVSVEFETTPEFVEYLLPPCLEPAERPSAMANVSRWQSTYCGEFDLAWVAILARYGDYEGWYSVSVLLNGDTPISTGREQWGEIKKRAELGYYHDGPHVYGFGQRNGVKLVEVDATFGPDEGPAEGVGHTLEIKAFLDTYGNGFEYDPLMVVTTMTDTYRSVRRGTAELTLRGTEFDPLDTMPIVSVGEAFHTVGETIVSVEATDPLTNRDDYLPYILGRFYDDVRCFKQPARYRASQLAQ
jgi:acetoacetate decarboxylase